VVTLKNSFPWHHISLPVPWHFTDYPPITAAKFPEVSKFSRKVVTHSVLLNRTYSIVDAEVLDKSNEERRWPIVCSVEQKAGSLTGKFRRQLTDFNTFVDSFLRHVPVCRPLTTCPATQCDITAMDRMWNLYIHSKYLTHICICQIMALIWKYVYV